ncbi:MAG: hypothetical protein IJG83_09395, partial [Thermoguttaceae bacterium]|nr:hypothetical protein [Thermoguttaceae bacterium]
ELAGTPGAVFAAQRRKDENFAAFSGNRRTSSEKFRSFLWEMLEFPYNIDYDRQVGITVGAIVSVLTFITRYRRVG